jgi:hypothetical protein
METNNLRTSADYLKLIDNLILELQKTYNNKYIYYLLKKSGIDDNVIAKKFYYVYGDR